MREDPAPDKMRLLIVFYFGWSSYLGVPIGEVADLPVPLTFIRLALEATDRRVADNRGLLGQGGHCWGLLLRTVKVG